ncbi:MAG: hypothetical protein QOE92_857 [Chloroflexota bacterium]|jgi:class 3 adenylate cyclase|nr:hypothetical protein [Chloroflexota bacterium]
MDSSVRYTRNGDVHVAYRVFGEGPRDIVVIPGTISHVELLWEIPSNRHLLEGLTRFARVIVFDKRGQGLSDRAGEQTLEGRISDVRAVMDAAGSEQATIYGWSEGGPMCLMFAATYPERTSALVLYGTFASIREGPPEVTPEAFERFLDRLTDNWGQGALLKANAPSRRGDPAFLDWFSRFERAAASPGGIVALMRANYDIDVRHLLPTVQAPTLILHRAGDQMVHVDAGRKLAASIPGARYAEIPGSDHMVTDLETQDVILGEIEEFITGARAEAEPDHVLSTVMFTDMVGSTERAANLGHARWSELVTRFFEVLRAEVESFRGREVKDTGDGLVATFDGPARAVRCAASLRDQLRPLGIQVRTGLHTGECELIGGSFGGLAVHIAARVGATAAADEVLVSSTVKDLVAGSGLQFTDRGGHSLKGVPDEWRLFSLDAAAG